jgi:hypothetical protein
MDAKFRIMTPQWRSRASVVDDPLVDLPQLTELHRMAWEGILMRARVLALGGAAVALVSLHVGAAEAATGPDELQRLATAQTQLLLRNLKTPPGEQIASPTICNQDQSAQGTNGIFLLPTRAGGSGNVTFKCDVQTSKVLVDLGGAFATEDANPNSTWTTKQPRHVLRFTRENLEPICDDIITNVITAPLAAQLDGRPLAGATAVSTPPFTSSIRQSTGQLYQDSVDLGHPGSLATTYCGWKAEVPLSAGDHQITVKFADRKADPFTFTYNITVSP